MTLISAKKTTISSCLTLVLSGMAYLIDKVGCLMDIRDKDEFLRNLFPKTKYEILPFSSQLAKSWSKQTGLSQILIVSPLKYAQDKCDKDFIKECVLDSATGEYRPMLEMPHSQYKIPSIQVSGTEPYIVVPLQN